MTIAEIQAFVVSIDPNAGHYESAFRGSDAYTEWREDGTLPFMGDNRHQGGIHFIIDRYTKDENDAIAAAFFSALEEKDDVAFSYIVDSENEWIHHIFVCEGC